MKEPSATTIKRLFALSNNRCAFPRCISPIISLLDHMIIGEINHDDVGTESQQPFFSLKATGLLEEIKKQLGELRLADYFSDWNGDKSKKAFKAKVSFT